MPQWGSSPRMRGTRTSNSSASSHAGIIPAHAGNTAHPKNSTTRYRDHPRACGEHFFRLNDQLVKTGSSPRMRGTHDLCRRPDSGEGIIPAHAGNTRSQRLTASYHRDHPRACGEHGHAQLAVGTRSGSSPRMRGTLRDVGAVRVTDGIIPAHAGNTSGRR